MMTLEGKSPLLFDGEYHLANVVVSICERGTASFNYDFTTVVIRTNDIFIGLPGHIISLHEVSDDYRAKLVVISDVFCNKARNLNLPLYTDIYGYNTDNSVFHLSGEQYAQMNEAFNMLHTVSTVGKKWKENMMLYAFLNIIMLHHEFCPDYENREVTVVSGLSARFQEAVVKHFRESSHVDFYARMFGLSPKYFSFLVRNEMGITPRKWIMRYIAMQSKTMLLKRTDLNIQQIADLMGFSDQGSFTRFFKNYVGVTPKEYRVNPKPLK